MATTLVYTKAPFVPFTKIVSADMNQYFTDLKNRLNWAGGTNALTGLGDDNLQSNAAAGGGLTRSTKLKTGTAGSLIANDLTGKMSEVAAGPAGNFLSTGGAGTLPTWVGNPLSSQYNLVVGSTADVTSGAAQYSSLVTALAAAVDKDRVLLLPTYNSTENVTITKQLLISGLGKGSLIDGTVTFGTGSSGTIIQLLKVSDNVTINSDVNEITANINLASNKTFIDNSPTTETNNLVGMQE